MACYSGAPMFASPSARLTPATIALLTLPPLMWAGNAVVGRLMNGLIPPITLNLLRWVLVLLLLLPWTWWIFRARSGLWANWRRFGLLGVLSVGSYNALQYMALKTSTPLNVTLVAASMPVWMLLLGRVLFGVRIARRAALGALLSVIGVAVVLSRGDVQGLLAIRLVPGDALMLLAAMVWSWYSWLLVRPPAQAEPAAIKSDWAAYLAAQTVFGLGWTGLMAGVEWAVLDGAATHIQWGWPLVLGLLYVAVGASLVAYRCWGAGVARVGPATAGFFANLTPLFAGLMSTLMLGEPPHAYHVLGFVLIVGGILVSSRR